MQKNLANLKAILNELLTLSKIKIGEMSSKWNHTNIYYMRDGLYIELMHIISENPGKKIASYTFKNFSDVDFQQNIRIMVRQI